MVAVKNLAAPVEIGCAGAGIYDNLFLLLVVYRLLVKVCKIERKCGLKDSF
jgi:hypothetical protein